MNVAKNRSDDGGVEVGGEGQSYILTNAVGSGGGCPIVVECNHQYYHHCHITYRGGCDIVVVVVVGGGGGGVAHHLA